jgi:hypothetical protein
MTSIGCAVKDVRSLIIRVRDGGVYTGLFRFVEARGQRVDELAVVNVMMFQLLSDGRWRPAHRVGAAHFHD